MKERCCTRTYRNGFNNGKQQTIDLAWYAIGFPFFLINNRFTLMPAYNQAYMCVNWGWRIYYSLIRQTISQGF